MQNDTDLLKYQYFCSHNSRSVEATKRSGFSACFRKETIYN